MVESWCRVYGQFGFSVLAAPVVQLLVHRSTAVSGIQMHDLDHGPRHAAVRWELLHRIGQSYPAGGTTEWMNKTKAWYEKNSLGQRDSPLNRSVIMDLLAPFDLDEQKQALLSGFHAPVCECLENFEVV